MVLDAEGDGGDFPAAAIADGLSLNLDAATLDDEQSRAQARATLRRALRALEPGTE
ncbi:MAG: hypothetical protein AAFU82_15705 [Pseudomonadota bacterium]